MATKNSIVMRQGQAQRVQLERIPAAALYPGHLIELTSADKFQKHAVVGGSVALAMFALEDENVGKNIDQVFGTTSKAVGWIPQKGDWVLAILKDGQNVAIGDKLESGAGGLVQKHTADTVDSATGITVYDGQIIGIAMEALDLSDSSGGESVNTFDLGYDQRLWIMIV